MGKEFYTQGGYFANNPTWCIEASAWKAKQVLKIISRNNLSPKSVCEIGCGAGEILNQLHQQMPEDITFAGYEISPQAFMLAKERQKQRLQFYLKESFSDDGAIFDLVLAIDVCEHIEDCFSFLKDLKRKGSYKIFHIPLDISAQAVIRGSIFVERRQRFGHIHYFTKETALALLEDAGYKILDCFYTAGAVVLPAKTLLSLLAKLPRKILFSLHKDLAVRLLGGYSLMVLAR